jgi:dihydrofolate reductase
MPQISLIAALSTHTRAIGKHGKLLWHIPEDLTRFKQLTLGHTVIMGRKTWESLPESVRPLPGRTNIVVSRSSHYAAPGALSVTSLEEALAKSTPGEVFVIGGGELYATALPQATRLYLTLVDDPQEGDAFFPEYLSTFPTRMSEEQGTHPSLKYLFEVRER